MIVEAAEVGDRPTIFTKARRNAPQGVRALAEILADQNWADKALVILDWQPEELAQSEYKHDAIVRIFVFKRVPEKDRRLTVSMNLDVNDIFTLDQITRNDLVWITEELQKKVQYELDRAGVAH